MNLDADMEQDETKGNILQTMSFLIFYSNNVFKYIIARSCI